MEFYKLVDVLKDPINVSVLTKRAKGGSVYTYKRMEPGMAYEMPTDDPIFRKSIIAATADTTMAKKEVLDMNDIKYEIIRPTCHCRKPFIRMKCVEVFNDEPN